jgi:hypothetical protein
MSEYDSLLEAFTVGETKQAPEQDSANTRALLTILAFSLNPFIIFFSKAINIAGLLPFLAVTIVLTLMFFYFYLVIIEACRLSRSTSYSEVLNNYFHRIDRVFSSLLFLYCFMVLCICQMNLTLTTISQYYDNFNEALSLPWLILSIVLLNAIMIFLSSYQDIKQYFYFCIGSLAMWGVCLLGMVLILIQNWSRLSEITLCAHYWSSLTFPYSIYILVVILNTFNSVTIVFKDHWHAGSSTSRNQILRTIVLRALVITLVFYIIFGVLLSFTDRPVAGGGAAAGPLRTVLYVGYRLFKYAWYVLQVCLFTFAVRSSFVQAFCPRDFDLGHKGRVALSSAVIALSALSNVLLLLFVNQSLTRKENGLCHLIIDNLKNQNEYGEEYEGYESEYGENQQDRQLGHDLIYQAHYFLHEAFVVTGILAVVVGMGIPWLLMIRTGEYEKWKVGTVGVVVGIVAVAAGLPYYKTPVEGFPL